MEVPAAECDEHGLMGYDPAWCGQVCGRCGRRLADEEAVRLAAARPAARIVVT